MSDETNQIDRLLKEDEEFRKLVEIYGIPKALPDASAVPPCLVKPEGSICMETNWILRDGRMWRMVMKCKNGACIDYSEEVREP